MQPLPLGKPRTALSKAVSRSGLCPGKTERGDRQGRDGVAGGHGRPKGVHRYTEGKNALRKRGAQMTNEETTPYARYKRSGKNGQGKGRRSQFKGRRQPEKVPSKRNGKERDRKGTVQTLSRSELSAEGTAGAQASGRL